MQQPTLAPAPHSHASLQEAAAEQTLRAHLLPHIGSAQATTTGAAPPTQPSAPAKADVPQNVNPNIDPAISGAGRSQQQLEQPQKQQHQPSQQQPIQQQTQQAQQQQQQQQMPQMPQQHPQSPSVQMGTSPVMSQGMTMDQQHSQPQSGAEESEQPKLRVGKRELSTSKRAAQNRAAQRAFRQRKEGYIKKLEEQVRDFTTMQESYKQIQSENYQLRDYIINIQSRLIESQGEDAVPPPPPVFLHPAPPLMLLDTSQSTGTPQASQPGQQVSPPVQLPQAVQSQPVQIQQHPSAPTANMQPQQQSVLQVPQGVPIAAAPTHQSVVGEIASAGQKRAHDDATDQAFLQCIAQAAGTTTGNGFVPVSHSPQAAAPQTQQQQQQPIPRKSTSPAAKRVKGEKVEAADGETMNGS